MHLFWIFSSMATAVFATSCTSAPAGCISVESGGSYSTIQAAIDSFSTNSSDAQCIFINKGAYPEQIYIAPRRAKLTIYGYTTDDSSYTDNEVTITNYSSLASGAPNDDATATVRNWAAGTKFYNINIENTYGKGSQALALSAFGDRQGYYGCGLYGYQDTLLSQKGYQVYGKCYIEGATDFIFGQHARTWIDSSDIRVSAAGSITASGRASSSDTSYYVINNSSVEAECSSTVKPGTVYLGRPWFQYARVCFQNTALSDVVNSTGWGVWGKSTPNTDNVTFEEYGNTGAGASGKRASFSKKLSSPISISTILDYTYASWVDTSYLA